MRRQSLMFVLAGLLAAAATFGQQTPPAMVDGYESLADTILALRQAEAAFVRALLDGHRHAAEARMGDGNWQGAAAEMALFANEGDNAVGGVRKRLLEGGHHFNARGEELGLYDPGYVIVTREAKQAILAAAAALRRAGDDAARQRAWEDFAAVTAGLLEAGAR